MAKVNVRPEGGMELDSGFFLQSDGMRPHQVRLQGGDASSDSRRALTQADTVLAPQHPLDPRAA
jgi:hypothetical protein